MRFVTNGPDIPEELIEAHKAGKVVFFCGAGISAPLGLPTFQKLVRLLYKSLDTVAQKDEYPAVLNGQY